MWNVNNHTDKMGSVGYSEAGRLLQYWEKGELILASVVCLFGLLHFFRYSQEPQIICFP